MLIALIVVSAYALLVTLLVFIFPRNTVVVHHDTPSPRTLTKTVTDQIMRDIRASRHYDCGCRIVGAVGDPGCNSCTEPGLR